MKKTLPIVATTALVFITACSTQNAPEVDTTAPSVTLASAIVPAGAASVRLTAEAADNVGVTRVEFYDNLTLLGQDSTAPFTLDLRSSNYPVGASNLSARAYDASGNVGLSSAAAILVERRVGLSGATVGGGATAPGGTSTGAEAVLPLVGSFVDLKLPVNLVAGKYALDLRGRGEDAANWPEVSLELNGKPYSNVRLTTTTTTDITVNDVLLTLEPGWTIRVRSTGGGKAYVAGLRLEPALTPPPAIPSGGDYRVEVLETGLRFPTSIAFLPNADLLILQRGDARKTGATIEPIQDAAKLLRRNMTNDQTSIISGMPSTYVAAAGQETIAGGAVGLAVDPAFASNNYVYICYQYLDSGGTPRNGLSRFVLDLNTNTLSSKQMLVPNIPAGANHNGCRVILDNAGLVYLTTGDANTEDTTKLSQDTGSPAGKVLRVNRDGSIPADNPIQGNPLWSLGHRNPQGLAFQPATGALWSTEHGAGTKDELNVIEKYKNYGWPDKSCLGVQPTCPSATTGSGYKPAVKEYLTDSTLALSDIAFYDGDAFPTWKGRMLMATLKTRRVMLVTLDGQRVVAEENLITGDEPENYGRVRDVAVGPDGYIYASTEVTNVDGDPQAEIPAPNPLGGMLLRIRPN